MSVSIPAGVVAHLIYHLFAESNQILAQNSKLFEETGSMNASKHSMKSPFMASAAMQSNHSTMTANTANVKGKLQSLEVSYRIKVSYLN